MGLREDLERYRSVGEERRDDLADFIRYGDLGASRADAVRIPIKIVDPPEFVYDERDRGGVGRGDAEVGDPVELQPGPGDAPGEAGAEPGEHDYYEMDPEEFARELDDELGLDLEPKGKDVAEEVEGEYTDVARTGPRSTLDVEHFFREGLKRKLATDFDREYLREALRIDGWGPERVFRWARGQHVAVSRGWLEVTYDGLDDRTRWADVDEFEANVEPEPAGARIRREGLRRLPFRPEDERFRHPEVVEVPEHNVVVVNIRDVSGSMREEKRELVERTFTPLDWYLTGKYDHAEFVYIAHDASAWEVEREEFFGISSGGGTRISSAYEVAGAILDEGYPWAEWNRYVFAAGDSENGANDTGDHVIPLMERIDANLHAYLETRPNGSSDGATHADEVEEHFADAANVVVTRVQEPDDVVGAIYDVLSTEDDEA